ncbi:MAG: AEC family transporter [Bacteroidota bacterium]|nr:AEC family transporter [Bacteroidota bacterium]
MSSFILLFLCLSAGILIRRLKIFPQNSHQTLNHFIIYITLPALSLYYIPEIELDKSLLLPVGVSWIIFLGSLILFWGLGKFLGWSRKLTGCLILMSGLGNTAFIGYPVMEALYGDTGLKAAILVDQPGSFMVVSTLGIAVAIIFSKAQTSIYNIIYRIFSFPPFITFLVALFMNMADLHFNETLKEVWQRLGSTVTPLALVSVGLQLQIERSSQHWNFLILGLAYSLIVSPAIIYLFYVIVFKAKGEIIQVSILQAAMAPMITPSIIAATYNLKPKLANMMIGIGIPISFITLTIWFLIIKNL